MNGLTEYLLTKKIADHFSLLSYKVIENSRNIRTGGGVGFYIKKDLEYSFYRGLCIIDEDTISF